jgi:hypothetical protein
VISTSNSAVQVLGQFSQPAFMPCPDCGASVARAESDRHVCEQERYLDYQLFAEREGVEAFEDDFGAYLDSPEGQFEQWDAERGR